MGDYERKLHKLFQYATQMSNKKNPTFKSINLYRTSDFKTLLIKFNSIYNKLVLMKEKEDGFLTSDRLLNLLTSINEKKGLLPEMEYLIEQFTEITHWTMAGLSKNDN